MLRIFSKNNDLSCNDYLRNKKGKTILTNLKSKTIPNATTNKFIVNNNKIVYYLSYNDFLILTQTFYKFSNVKKKYKPPQQIIDLKTSFIFYNKFLDHIQNCDTCKNNDSHLLFQNCKEIQNILYPFGEHLTYEIYSELAPVNLNYWCTNKECSNNIVNNVKNINGDDDYEEHYFGNLKSCDENSCSDSSSDSYTSSLNNGSIKPYIYQPTTQNLSNSSSNSRSNSSYISSSNSSSNSSYISTSNSSYISESNENSNINLSTHDEPSNLDIKRTNNKMNTYMYACLEEVTDIVTYKESDKILNNKKIFSIFIAELTNSKDYTHNKNLHNDFEKEDKYYNVYNFIPICLNFEEFKIIFFNSNTQFFNISNVITEKIKLSNQYFKNINNELEPFKISNSIKKIYIEKNNYSIIMDANTIIEIEKETKKFESLYDFNYITNSLSLDDIITIINENNIETNNNIKIKIKVYYKSEQIDVPCIMYFNYIIQNMSENINE